MSSLQTIAGIIGLGAYIPLLYGIYRNDIKQNFVAFMLWAILDIIVVITTKLQNGNYMLPLAYALGATLVTISLGIKKQVAWSWIETLTSFLVLVCLLVWGFVGPKAGTLASSIAVVIAGIPQVIDTYKKPKESSVLVYFLFLIPNVLSFLAGKAWTIEERFYSGSVIVFTVVIIIFAMRKFKNPLTSVTP